jgi:pimeloyl-ACP methyl ester carboxylesterase
MVKPLPDPFRERWAHISLLLPPYARKWLMARNLNNVDLVPKITVPLLLTAGEHDPLMVAAKGEELIAQLRPGTVAARMVVFDGVGHAPFIEDPERYNRELAEFAQDVFEV